MRLTSAIAALTMTAMCGIAQTNWQNNQAGAAFARLGGESPEGTFRLVSDGYEVFTLVCSDKSHQPASLFYGENNADKEKVDALAPSGEVATSMNCFVVKTVNGYAMFDTGLPASKGGKTLERLAALNISPNEIGAIYITHGHFDHIGGLLDEDGEAAFPNATLYIPANEMEFIKQSSADFATQAAKAYAGRMTIFAAGEILPDNVLAISAKGHTPGHTAYLLGNLFFVGDLMHGAAVQLADESINANYDRNRTDAAATRSRLLRFAAANSLTVLCAHVPNNGVIF